jgi:AcrR family transcriptional regulator
VPTGVALHDARQQLFDAAERVLLREGAVGLTSRSVTAEAGVAKGVLHRHFDDFDAFLTELVLDRVASLKARATDLRDRAGTGTVIDNLTDAVMVVLRPIGVAVIGLVIARDTLRARLRQAGTARLPFIGEGTAMITSYLRAERELGRLASDTDVKVLAPTLIGAAHLAFTDREAGQPTRAAIRKIVAAVVAGATGGSR